MEKYSKLKSAINGNLDQLTYEYLDSLPFNTLIPATTTDGKTVYLVVTFFNSEVGTCEEDGWKVLYICGPEGNTNGHDHNFKEYIPDVYDKLQEYGCISHMYHVYGLNKDGSSKGGSKPKYEIDKIHPHLPIVESTNAPLLTRNKLLKVEF